MSAHARPVLHRSPVGERWFEFRGRTYMVSKGSDRPERDGSRYIARIRSARPGDFTVVVEGFGYMSEVHALLAKATAEGWDYLSWEDGQIDQPTGT